MQQVGDSENTVTEMTRLSVKSTRSDTMRRRASAVWNLQSNSHPENENYKTITQYH